MPKKLPYEQRENPKNPKKKSLMKLCNISKMTQILMINYSYYKLKFKFNTFLYY